MTAVLKIIKVKHLFIVYLIALVNFVIIKFFGNITINSSMDSFLDLYKKLNNVSEH